MRPDQLSKMPPKTKSPAEECFDSLLGKLTNAMKQGRIRFTPCAMGRRQRELVHAILEAVAAEIVTHTDAGNGLELIASEAPLRGEPEKGAW